MSRFIRSSLTKQEWFTSDRQYSCMPTTTHGIPAARALSIAFAVQV
jgi:hypothetical protein